MCKLRVVHISLIFLFVLMGIFFFGCSSERSTREKLEQMPYDTFFEHVDHFRENYAEMEELRKEIYLVLILNLELLKEHDAGMKELWEDSTETDTTFIVLEDKYEKEEKLIEVCLQRKNFDYCAFRLEKLDKWFVYDFIGCIDLFFDDIDLGEYSFLSIAGTPISKQDVVISLLFAYCDFSDTAPSGWRLVDCKLKTFLGDVEFPKINKSIKAKEQWENE